MHDCEIRPGVRYSYVYQDSDKSPGIHSYRFLSFWIPKLSESGKSPRVKARKSSQNANGTVCLAKLPLRGQYSRH